MAGIESTRPHFLVQLMATTSWIPDPDQPQKQQCINQSHLSRVSFAPFAPVAVKLRRPS